jgi:hypothetical protein
VRVEDVPGGHDGEFACHVGGIHPWRVTARIRKRPTAAREQKACEKPAEFAKAWEVSAGHGGEDELILPHLMRVKAALPLRANLRIMTMFDFF